MRLNSKTTSPARTAVAISFLLASSVAGQSSLSSVDSAVKSLPQCWQRCINTASQGAIHCNSGDNACVCRSYNTGFLTTVITCIKASCTDDLNLNVLVSPLQLYCASAGSPINPSAVSDAQHLITQSVSSLSSTGTMKPMTTMTLTTTDADGNEFLAAVPASVGDDTTVFGTPKTVTATSTTSSASSQSAAPDSGSPTTASGATPTDSGSSSSSTASATNGRPNGSPFDATAQFQAEGAGATNRVASGLLGFCAAAVGGWLLL